MKKQIIILASLVSMTIVSHGAEKSEPKCEKGPLEKIEIACYTMAEEALVKGEFSRAESLATVGCDAGSFVGCITLARILDSEGKFDDAQKMRKSSCEKNIQFCRQYAELLYYSDMNFIFDAAEVLCKEKSNKPTGRTSAKLFPIVCPAPENTRLSAWIGHVTKMTKSYTEILEKIKSENEKLPVEIDFVKNPTQWNSFYTGLSKRKFPVRVKFKLSKVSSGGNLGDYLPKKESLFLTEFSSGSNPKGSWRDAFSGYMAIPVQTMFDLSKKFPTLTGGAAYAVVTGLVVGYKGTGVIDIPIVVLDSAYYNVEIKEGIK